MKNYSDAHSAIGRIVSEAGTRIYADNAGSLLDFRTTALLSHGKCAKNQVLTRIRPARLCLGRAVGGGLDRSIPPLPIPKA